MSFMDDLRSKINKTRLGSKDRNLLKVILGELQNLPGSGKSKVADPDDARCIGHVESIIKSNEATIEKIRPRHGMGAKVEELEIENDFLRLMLPDPLSFEQIREHLKNVDVASAPNMGPAIGMAMGYFKKLGLELQVKGNVVKQIVEEIRGG